MAKRSSRAEKNKREIKIDMGSEEEAQDLKDWAEELGISHSQLARALILYAKSHAQHGKLSLTRFLIEGKLSWLKSYDIDFEEFKRWLDEENE